MSIEDIRAQIVLNLTSNINVEIFDAKLQANFIIDVTDRLIQYLIDKRTELNDRIFKKKE